MHLQPGRLEFAADPWHINWSTGTAASAATVRHVEDADSDVAADTFDAEQRLRRYSYLTSREFPRTYFAIMRVFSSTLLADLSAADVSSALAGAERDGRIEAGESSVDRVVDRLTQLRR